MIGYAETQAAGHLHWTVASRSVHINEYPYGSADDILDTLFRVPGWTFLLILHILSEHLGLEKGNERYNLNQPVYEAFMFLKSFYLFFRAVMFSYVDDIL